MSKKWQTGKASHQGTRKNTNEDSYLHRQAEDSEGNEIAMFAVADGMGGYEVGDTASKLAISFFEKWWDKRILKLLKKRDIMERIAREGASTMKQINASIKATSLHTRKKMGTTLSLLIMYKGKYVVIHVGDSRIYQMRGWNYGLQQYFHQADQQDLASILQEQSTEILESNPELVKLTEDHSWVERQVTDGILSEEDARNHPKRNVLTQCLGIEDEVNPQIQIGDYQSSDMFLVCSDGFHSLFSNEEILTMLINLEKEYTNLQMMCEYLINFCNFSKAEDNITLMLIRNLYVENPETKGKHKLLSLLGMK
ncbi:PP2C family protein-serine/threonine phosphatase [Oceanobacillus kapialis]|uniref:PP2C family protein-serine/threonine phosphatase n=1 Tax=Oceanobacillus kapialis TaxID=481353 RepID=A0ABW5Q614_9BACI